MSELLKDVEELIQMICSKTNFYYVSNFYRGLDSNFKRDNLTRYILDMIDRSPTTLIVGESPTYDGCRRTGIPFTNEYVVSSGVGMTPESGLFRRNTEYITRGKSVEELSHTFWNQVWKLVPLPLLWYVFPLQPYLPGNRKMNRHPTFKELKYGRAILDKLLDLFNIDTLTAVGKYTDYILEEWDLPHTVLPYPTSDNEKRFAKDFYRIFPILVQVDQSKIKLGPWKTKCEGCEKVVFRDEIEIINNLLLCPECSEFFLSEYGPSSKYFG